MISVSLKVPKLRFLFSFLPANSLATASTEILSVLSLRVLSIVRFEKRSCDIVERSQVFNRLAAENNLSPEALLARLTRIRQQILATSVIIVFSSPVNFDVYIVKASKVVTAVCFHKNFENTHNQLSFQEGQVNVRLHNVFS